MSTSDAFFEKHTFFKNGEDAETLDVRLKREIPESAAQDVPFERQPDAVGELVSDPLYDGEDEEQVILAEEAGDPREDAPAEQQAMHLVDEAEQIEEEFSPFTSDVDDEEAEFDGRHRARPIHRDDSSEEFVFDSEYEDDEIPMGDVD